jgi:SAM-dependent methyltransferase
VRVFRLPPSDEPPDFRRQAAAYRRHRRGYSRALYDAIEAAAGRPATLPALDVGCGTGLVSDDLRARGWALVAVDFSAPMLAEARDALGSAVPMTRARSEALPVAASRFALVACGTAFHWFDRLPALAEMHRALAEGGWAAIFWRYPRRGEPTAELVREVLARFGAQLPGEPVTMHPPEPFAGSPLHPQPEIVLDVELSYTAAGFHGYASSTEFLRRVAGPHHAAFLDALREELERRYPNGLVERCREHLFLAQRAASALRLGGSARSAD